MEPFKVHILGCGSALPTLRHNPSSQVVEVRGKMFMVDCGEGTQLQLRRVKVRFTKVSAVFISHLHGDHCFGLIGMISTFGLLGRTAALHVYAHKDLEETLKWQIGYFCHGLEYEVVFHAIDPTQQKVIYEDRSVEVETVPLKHRPACCGFIFREKPTLPHIRRDMIDCYEIPISQINNIKLGADWTAPDGTVVPNSRLVLPADKPRSYAYCSDTRYFKQLANSISGLDTLYHEATYDASSIARARQYNHSTAEEAATVAHDAKVKQLIIGHFSARYEDETILLDEARKVFPNTVLAAEGKSFDV